MDQMIAQICLSWTIDHRRYGGKAEKVGFESEESREAIRSSDGGKLQSYPFVT